MLFETEEDRRSHLQSIASIFAASGNFGPTLFMEMNGKKVCTCLDMRTAEKKQEVTHMIKMGIATGMMREFCFASESWMATVKDPSRVTRSPKHRKDRQEGIIVNFASAKEEHIYFAIIKRDENGKPTLQEFDKWNTGEISGQFAGLFNSAAAMTN